MKKQLPSTRLLRTLYLGAEDHLLAYRDLGSLQDEGLDFTIMKKLAKEAKAFAAFLLPNSKIGNVFFANGFELAALFLVEVGRNRTGPGIWVFVGDVSPIAFRLTVDDTDLSAMKTAADIYQCFSEGKKHEACISQGLLTAAPWQELRLDEGLRSMTRSRAEMIRELVKAG